MLEAKEVPISEILGTKYSRILTYPSSNEIETKARCKDLFEIGVSALVFRGQTLIDGVPILGKGNVGLVVHAIMDREPVALKIRRTDADRPSMSDEGRLLRQANSVDIGPQLMTSTRNFLAMQLFEGLALFRWFEKARKLEATTLKKTLGRLLYSCFKLDSIGLDHGELSHAPKNVLVSRTGEPCIVDFESASTVRRVANVTSILQYFLFGRVSKIFRPSKIFPRRNFVLKFLSAYKQKPSVESFKNLLEVLDLPS